MIHLLNVLNSTDPRAVLQTNLERLDAWMDTGPAIVQGGVRFDPQGDLWLQCGDTLYRKLIGVLVDGVATLTLGDETQPADWNPNAALSLGRIRFDGQGNLWFKCGDELYRKLIGTLVDGVPTLTLGDATES